MVALSLYILHATGGIMADTHACLTLNHSCYMADTHATLTVNLVMTLTLMLTLSLTVWGIGCLLAAMVSHSRCGICSPW